MLPGRSFSDSTVRQCVRDISSAMSNSIGARGPRGQNRQYRVELVDEHQTVAVPLQLVEKEPANCRSPAHASHPARLAEKCDGIRPRQRECESRTIRPAE
jgi:hypothetical protein